MTTDSSPPAQRLQLLAAYVEQDPENAALLAEACDAALACGRHDQAAAYLAAGERSAPDSLDWPFRRAQLCIARGELQDARDLLERLRTDTAGDPAVLHDLAYVHLLLGDAATSAALLVPCVERDLPRELQDRVQALWLRACHHLGETARACEWIARKPDGELGPEAAGVASLIAWDEEQRDPAARLADRALAQQPAQREALITRGLIALAGRDSAKAIASLQEVQQRHPEDPRTLSSLGFAWLLAGDVAQAEPHLRKAAGAWPEHAPTLQALGWARLLLGDRTGALDALARALAADPEAADAHASVALAFCIAGDRETATAHLQRAEQIDAQDPTARLVRAVLATGMDAGARESLLRQLFAQWSPRA